MAGAPVCHIPTDQSVVDQPTPARFPSVPQAVDLKSALAAINALRFIVQQLSGQIPFTGQNGSQGLSGGPGGFALQGSQGVAGPRGATGAAGKAGKNAKASRYVEDRSQRVETNVTITSDDGESFVKFIRTDRVVWIDQVTGQSIVFSR